ncbi:unnamed protein product [Peniophora sp. CBMAI 1063]|nr:unnamed protein product [Peniophora sp. CBMAI 1063]
MPPRKRAAERVQADTFLPELPAKIADIFETVQSNRSSWTRNNVILYKLHVQASEITEDVGQGRVKVIGLRAFEDAVLACVCEIMGLKKGVAVGDRANAFLAGYAGYVAEQSKDATLAEHFVNKLFRELKPGLRAKSAPARFRSAQLIAGMLRSLENWDEKVVYGFREEMVDRLNDKEAAIRVQAVLALASICADEAEWEGDELSLADMLSDVLTHDNAPDVRRAALANIPVTPETLPHVLSRTRDSDTVTRRFVYQGVLEKQIHQPDSEDPKKMTFGPTHPRVLSIAQREEILRAGLADRADNVREAAAALVRAWVSVAHERPAKSEDDEDDNTILKAEDKDEQMPQAANAQGDGEQEDQKLVLTSDEVKARKTEKVQSDLCMFLRSFDLAAGSTDVAQSALLSVFATDKERFSQLNLTEDWWNTLTPERVFLGRVYVEYCTDKKLHERVDDALPPVTALAFHLQGAYNKLIELPEPEGDEDEVAAFAREDALFTVKEMLAVAKIHDYTDEAGRRRMFKLVRDMVAQEALPDELVTPSLDVLRLLCGGEKELIMLIVEIIIDLRDLVKIPVDGAQPELDASQDESGSTANAMPMYKRRDEMTEEECQRSDAMDVRCLDLCIGMLERVNGTVDDHPSLNGLVTDFIVPSVRRRELTFREKGLHCLGLVALINPGMAPTANTLFRQHLAPQGPGQLPPPALIKRRLLEIVVDVAMVHSQKLKTSDDGGKPIADFILSFADEDEQWDVQAKAVIGVVKLLFAGMITEPQVLGDLWLQYISPHTRENHSLRQCLAYFFEKYCLASPVFQRRMMTQFVPVYKQLVHAHRTSEEDVAQYLVQLPVFVDMFLNYVNPASSHEVPGRKEDEDIHIDLAINVLRELLKPEKFGHGFEPDPHADPPEPIDQTLDKTDRKILCNIFKSEKLYLPIDADDHAVRTLKLLVSQTLARRPIKDSAAMNAIAKFDTKLDDRYGEAQLDGFSEEDARKLEKLEKLFEFLDDLIPLDDEEEDFPIEPRKRGKPKRNARSASVASTTTDEESDATVTGKGKGKKSAKGRGKRRRLSEEDEEESDEEEDDDDGASRASAPPSSAPTRSMPRRAATKKVDMTPMKLEGVDEEDEDEDEDEDDEEATPVPKRGAGRKQAIRSRRKPSLDPSESGGESNPVVVPDTSDVEDQEVDDLLLDEDE